MTATETGTTSATETSWTRSIERSPSRYERDPARYARRKLHVERALGAAVPLVLILVWQGAASFGMIDTRFLPSPISVAQDAVDLVRSGKLQEAVSVSLWRIFLGFVFGTVSGMLVGIAMGLSSYIRAALDPLLSALYTVPKLALLPLFLLVFGLGDLPIILTIVVSVFFFMWIATMAAFAAVDDEYREAAQVFRASRWATFWHVLLPAALPEIFTGLRLSAGMSVLVVIGIEFVNANGGVGALIWNSWQLFLAPQMYVGIAVTALLGVAISALIALAARFAMPWYRPAGGTRRGAPR